MSATNQLIAKLLLGAAALSFAGYLFWPKYEKLPMANLDPFQEIAAQMSPKAEAALKKAAESGNTKAESDYGIHLALQKKWPEATIWLKKAANNNDKDAASVLAVMYAQGDGIAPNYRESAKWFKIAGSQGSPIASYNLGIMYGEGIGVPKDYVTRDFWFTRAIEQINEAAEKDRASATERAILGRLYTKGLGVKQDKVKGYMWYALSLVSKKDPLVSKEKTEAAEHMSTKELASAEKLAREWQPKQKSENKAPTAPQPKATTAPPKKVSIPVTHN